MKRSIISPWGGALARDRGAADDLGGLVHAEALPRDKAEHLSVALAQGRERARQQRVVHRQRIDGRRLRVCPRRRFGVLALAPPRGAPA